MIFHQFYLATPSHNGLQPTAAAEARSLDLTGEPQPQDAHYMMFTKHLREGVRRGRIRCSIRIWTKPHVKAGGRYPMEEGQIVVDSIVPIQLRDITHDLARESGFSSVKELLQTARHGRGENVYLIRFHYLPPGGWDMPRITGEKEKGKPTTDRRRRG